MKYIEYAKHIGADEHLLKWCRNTLKKAVEKEYRSTEEVEHILDYLVQSGKKLERMSYDQALKLTTAWDKSQQKKGNGIIEIPEDVETVLDFNDGFRVVRLVGENAYKREGFLMRHCVASYFGKNVEIYSLRDKDNMPHCTMEKDQQIKGKGNGDISPKYINYVIQFLEHIGMSVGAHEMRHLGYIDMSDFKDELHKDTKFFKDKYLPIGEKLVDVDGNEFFSPDLFNIIPLLEKSESGLKINFNLVTIARLSFEWISKKVKISKESSATTGDRANSATAGYGAHSATAGNDAIAVAVGRKGKAKGSIGCFIVLAEWKEGEDFTDAKPICVISAKVDGKTIKADTWYKAVNGKFVETDDSNE